MSHNTKEATIDHKFKLAVLLGMNIGLTTVIFYVMILIALNGSVIVYEPNILILFSEILLLFAMIIFNVYYIKYVTRERTVEEMIKLGC